MTKANHQREFLRAFQGYYHRLEHRKRRAITKAQPQRPVITQGWMEARPVAGPRLPASVEDVQRPFKQLEISLAYIAGAFLHSMHPEIGLAERSMAAIDACYLPAVHCSIGQHFSKTVNRDFLPQIFFLPRGSPCRPLVLLHFPAELNITKNAALSLKVDSGAQTR